MSSMLKKTGGLSFKPKAGRRPAAPASKPSTASTPASDAITPAPTVEPPSQTSSPPVTTTASSNEASTQVSNEPRPTTKDSSQSSPQSQAVPTVTIQPTPESTISSTTHATTEPELAPQPVDSREISRTGQGASSEPTPEISSTDIQPPGEAAEIPSTVPAPAPAPAPAPPVIISQPSRATSTLTPHNHTQSRNTAAPPTAPPSPAPPSDTIAVVPSAEEPPPSTDDPAPTPDSTAAPKKRAPRKRKAPAAKTATTTDSVTPKVKRPRKKASKAATEDETTPADGEDATSVSLVKKAVRRRRRSPTPEDAENMTVDHTTTTVGELTKDLGIGKRFKHAEAIEERARQARAAYRMKKLEREKRRLGLLPEGEKDSESRAGTPAEGSVNQDGSEATAAGRGAGTGAAASGQGVGYEVIDGQIIINSQSLVVDRHAAHRDMSSMETVEEDDFTNLTTSSSYRRESRRTGPNIWDDEETEKFYRLLKMFGTDFETIAAMFPGRSRRAIKLKFNREEVLRPRRLNAAIMVRGEKKVGIDIDEYKASQARWQTSDKILADHAKLVEEHNEHLKQLRDERIAAGLMDETELDDIGNNNKDPDKDANADTEEVDETEEADHMALQEEEIQDMGEVAPVPVPVA
ncbi:hypothetical protein F4809DRAFT_588560 [Biscogniauxia mediterranea]|nr:hypothetical protein F4809DRAFT_588560 [Biscogniauxia mediterranea]